MRGRSLPLLLVSVVLAGSLFAAPWGEEGLQGRPLTEVLELLRERGLRIIYSSDLVEEELRVAEEPKPGSLYGTLQSVLAPHGLTTEVGPSGTLLVVRQRIERPLAVSLLRPDRSTVAAGRLEIEAAVTGDEPVSRVDFFVDDRRVASVDEPPFRASVSVGDDPSARTVRVVARGVLGGIARHSVTTLRVELREEMEVALKQIYVTAMRRGAPVASLGREDFAVFDDGEPRQLVTFDQGDLPLAAAILVDASKSMRGARLESAVRGVRAFAARMEPFDETSVFFFTDRPHQLVPFGTAPGDLLSEIDDLRAECGTALHDALYVALRSLDQRLGRHVVVLLSDGTDVSSVLSMDDVLWKLRRTDAQLYWIRLRSGGGTRDTISSSWRDAPGHREQSRLLIQAVEESGGRIEVLDRVSEVDDTLQRILHDLRGQYALGYYPVGRQFDGSWRPIEVRARVPGVELGYRPGYIDR